MKHSHAIKVYTYTPLQKAPETTPETMSWEVAYSREDGPYEIRRKNGDGLSVEKGYIQKQNGPRGNWRIMWQTHHPTEPAYLIYSLKGDSLRYVAYYRYGLLHRTEGPAEITRTGPDITMRWYHHGTLLDTQVT